jgi:hypothetical protein
MLWGQSIITQSQMSLTPTAWERANGQSGNCLQRMLQRAKYKD